MNWSIRTDAMFVHATKPALSLAVLLTTLITSCYGTTFMLTDFNRCTWTVNLASSKNPFKATSLYFNEKGIYDVHEYLKSPDITKFLHPVRKDGGSGYFVFPYFVMVRASCDTGLYDTSFYQVLIHGVYPTIVVEYQTPNARAPIRSSLRVTSFGAVVNLYRGLNDTEVPKNPADPICYAGLCYPAFVVPLVFLHAPIVSVTVEAVGRFAAKTAKIYSTPFHSRKTEKVSDLEFINPGDKSPPAKDYFPVNRIGTVEDPTGLPSDVLEDLKDDEHFPLDKDDFIEAKWTSGASTTLVFAGFYDPELVVVTDPEGDIQRLVRFSRNPLLGNKSDENATIFDHGLTCNLPETYGNDPNYPIPRFTTTESRGSNNSDWLSTYYRKRYKPMKYYQSPVPHAIYDALSLEDRLLLVTNSGLVSFYGITNITVDADMALKAPNDEKLRRCIKLVRAARFTQEDVDLVVAVSYRYNEIRLTTQTKRILTPNADGQLVTQEIYIGRLTMPGKPLDWQRVGENFGNDEDEETRAKAGGDSQVYSICYLVMDLYFHDHVDYIELESCWLIDAAPAVGSVVEKIQVLVEMTIIHMPTFEIIEKLNEGLNLVEDDAHVVFYALAEHTPLKYYTKETWQIVSVIPQRPCVSATSTSMTNIENLDTEYFRRYDPAWSDDDKVYEFHSNCHFTFRHNLHEELNIKRMTYTKHNTNQLYLYGNKLLHSSNGGGAFAYSPDFPSKEEKKEMERLNHDLRDPDNKDPMDERYTRVIRMTRKHVIRVMAFSTGADFAFLTSSRHLYLGSMGSLSLIRLRPSPGYSMFRLLVSDRPGIHDARPYAIIFNTENVLNEFVAVVDSNKKITMMRKRVIPVELIVRNINFVNKLKERVQVIDAIPKLRRKAKAGGSSSSAASTTTPQKSSLDKVVTMKTKRLLMTYCPYGDYRVYQNYSMHLRRMQQFIIRPPLQHPALGGPLSFTALMAYQASAYSLIYVTYLSPVVQPYSIQAADPFEGWVNETREEASVGFFRFISGDPYDYGIIVDPSTFKRVRDTEKSSYSMVERYYLDYNQVVLITLSFSVTTKGSLEKTDYQMQKLKSVHVTVDNGNGSIVDVETEKVLDYIGGVASFKIYLSVNKKTAHLPQSPPGKHSLIVPVAFHFVNAFGKCVKDAGSSIVGDSVHAKVFAGCPPGSELRLNGNMSVRSLRFRNPKNWLGMTKGECVHDQDVCFYSKLPVVLHFDSFDRSKQKNEPYHGHYVLRVIGGGYSLDSMVDYTPEEQEAYNVPGKSDVSLVWSEWDLKSNQKVQLKAREGEDDVQAPGHDVILKAGESAIKWTCHSLSPCARVLPSEGFQSVFYFKIRVSNRGIGGTFTSCLYERDFIIQLYGFDPSPEIQLLVSTAFSFFLLLFLYFMYLCFRNQKRLWRANKVKMYGWLQIVIDTFPKSRSVSDTSKELQDQLRHDEILMSLQGHLRVPKVVQPTKRREHLESTASITSAPSHASSESRDSSASRASSNQDDQTLPHVHARVNPATWTDMIYDQIIAKRLNAIVDRNNEIKESILRKVEMSEQKKTEVEKDDPPT